MAIAGSPIEAILTLDSSGFHTGISNAQRDIEKFASTVGTKTGEIKGFGTAIEGLMSNLEEVSGSLSKFTNLTKESENFNKFANGVKALASAVEKLGTDSNNASTGLTRVKEIIASWGDALNGIEVKVKGVSTAIKEMTNTQNQGIKVTQQYKLGATNVQSAVTSMSTSLAQGRQNLALYHQNLKQLALGVEQFNAIETKTQTGVDKTNAKLSQAREKLISMDNALAQGRQNLGLYHQNLKQLALGVEQFNAIETGHVAKEREVASATDQATNSVKRQATANRTATTSTEQLTASTNRLKTAMSSLRMIGTMVGSMLAYNFAHKLLVATGETIHAKSEMEGYFQMLNFGQRDINDFNNALDETVAKFQRVNKYALGETISSIGVEFELTTAEMKKAMPVVSMITSEYLRAGRNVNEASLAVKDILQGEFQRLSRETGVKGDQLKEMGWSGDKTDVMGLLDALDKIGKSRNWDVFAEKANSLNDILTIIQNRFGEWSAEVVYSVQPAIVGAFNMILESGQKLASGLEMVWNWLNGDGIENNIVKWTLLAGAIGTVATAFIVYRTGANLVQIAQMGLRGTITATILGLEAETVATYGSRTAILSKILSLKAETVATLSTKDAILSKILGINAEKVAVMGLKGAIGEEILARRIQEATMRNASATEMAGIYLEYQEQMAKRGTLATIMAKVLGLDMETFAQEGLSKAILVRLAQSKSYIVSLIAEKVATMGTAEATLFLVGTIGSLLAVIGLIVIAFGSWAIALNNSAQAMAKFNTLVDKGDDLIKENRKSVETYTKRQEALKKTLSETEKGTTKYYQTQDQLRAVNQDLIASNKNLEVTTKAVEKARSSQAKFDEISGDIQIHQQERLTEAYLKMGFTASESYELANESMREANEGAEQLRRTLSAMESASWFTTNKMNEFAQQFEDANFTDQNRMKELTQDYLSARDMYMKGLEKSMTDESFMGRLDGYFTMAQASIKMDLDELTIDWETGDVDEFWKDFWSNTFGGDFGIGGLGGINGLFRELGWDEMWKGFDISTILDPIHEVLSHTFGAGALLGLIFEGENFDGGSGVFLQFLESLPDPVADARAWLDEKLPELSTTIMECLTNIAQYDYLGEFLRTWNLENFDLGAWVNSWLGSLGQYVYTEIMNIPLVSDILSLFGLVNGENSGASQKGTEIANAFKTKVEDIVRNIPILGDVLQFLGVIPQANPTASSNGQGVGNAIKTGFKNGLTGIVDIIKGELDNIVGAIRGAIDGVGKVASDLGGAIVNGVRSGMVMFSPSIISREILPQEFGVNVPNAIMSSADTVYGVAQAYGQKIVDGVSSVTSNVGLGGMVQSYETDAQIVADSSQMMGIDTTTAFNDMSMAVNQTTSTMSGNVATTYSSMQTKQATSLNTMKTQNLNAYNDMYNKSNQSLIHMRDSTSNITQQMTNAWNHMKDQIVASANKLKNDSTVHFNTLSNTIGSFYRKIQNPSSWGSAGSPYGSSGRRNSRAGRTFASTIRHGAGGIGGTNFTKNTTMSIATLKRKLCPDGSCGDLFNGFNNSDVVNVSDFLSLMIGTGHGFGGWNTWDTTHYNHIKTKSDAWGMKSPTINLAGGIPTNADYKVGDFENGTPKISFSSFQSMAESIFTAIPYRFYYDSNWKGSWLGALQAGACNCWDGAHALLAFANSCGFSGSIVHGTWTDPDGTTYPHVWANINGKRMDTTGWQQRRSWSAGSPNAGASSSSNNKPPVNITVNVQNAYGIDDLNSQIEEGIDKGLQKHFNKNMALGV